VAVVVAVEIIKVLGLAVAVEQVDLGRKLLLLCLLVPQ
jgi:hypothetical protein